MARIKLSNPGPPVFHTEIPVLVSHINYGGHLGNDAVLSIVQEARIRYLKELDCTEMDAGGAGLIMADAAVVYEGEGFQGDMLRVTVTPFDISEIGFDLFYTLTCMREGKEIKIAKVKTGICCFDYKQRKVIRIPEKLKEKLLF